MLALTDFRLTRYESRPVDRPSVDDRKALRAAAVDVGFLLAAVVAIAVFAVAFADGVRTSPDFKAQAGTSMTDVLGAMH